MDGRPEDRTHAYSIVDYSADAEITQMPEARRVSDMRTLLRLAEFGRSSNEAVEERKSSNDSKREKRAGVQGSFEKPRKNYVSEQKPWLRANIAKKSKSKNATASDLLEGNLFTYGRKENRSQGKAGIY